MTTYVQLALVKASTLKAGDVSFQNFMPDDALAYLTTVSETFYEEAISDLARLNAILRDESEEGEPDDDATELTSLGPATVNFRDVDLGGDEAEWDYWVIKLTRIYKVPVENTGDYQFTSAYTDALQAEASAATSESFDVV